MLGALKKFDQSSTVWRAKWRSVIASMTSMLAQ